MSKQFGEIINETLSLFNIGDIYLHMNQPKKALEIFHNIENNYAIDKIEAENISITSIDNEWVVLSKEEI